MMGKDTMQTLTKSNLILISDKIDLNVEWEIKKFQNGQPPGRFNISTYVCLY